jgi:hypothetical protein
MSARLAELVLAESHWLPAAMLLGVLAAGMFLAWRGRDLPLRARILAAMNLFYGWMIGVMSIGHVAAVSVKAARGTLEGSPWFLYSLGVAVLVPSAWLALRAERFAREELRFRRRALSLNAWLGFALLALGLHNLPLAFPAALNIAYQLHTRRAVGWTIVSVRLAANLALFIGALIFLASGQTFEQFSGAY